MGVQVIPIPTEVVSHSLPFPFPILCLFLFPWESHGNGNKTQNWEWECTSLISTTAKTALYNASRGENFVNHKRVLIVVILVSYSH